MKENPDVVMPRLRPLRYRDDLGGVPEEKGVDVNLALGAVEAVVRHDCDTAIIFSHDTDLLPAVESLVRIGGRHSVETASWISDDHRSRLRTKEQVFHHFLDEAVFRAVETPVNYATE